MTEYLNVGKIVNTQGIKGEVRVISKTDFSDERYKKGKDLFLFQENKKPITLTVKSHRKHKNFDIISFEDHPNINDVEKYRDGILKVDKKDLGKLEKNAFYYHQIVGLEVFDEEGKLMGTIKEILSPGANDVWVIGQNQKGKKDILIPYIESVVTLVDIANNRVEVEIPEGLIDDEN
ncbi:MULTISPECIES: ribosome maturation factor RimM [Vagococcus]|uniref:Ribosome maturation factor RimM n=1 Tax=Vagococcus fluvialis bH819 TaxID=1255619 RepID=A0A1X6WR92_9ENTE|nr:MULTISPECIES: ribosome maturation factor RimM [Vagococcus]SLM86752.1 16S rRNA processing protein RimM [Vagococcus fluvialis bH819]HCM88788.1 ribosome maturation factor RimM [Vagococcus sp.]